MLAKITFPVIYKERIFSKNTDMFCAFFNFSFNDIYMCVCVCVSGYVCMYK